MFMFMFRGMLHVQGRLSGRREFTPVPLRGSVFIYITTKWDQREVRRRGFTPVVVLKREFHSCTKLHNSFM